MNQKQENTFEEIVQKVFDTVAVALNNGNTVKDVVEYLIQNGFPDNLAQAIVERIANSCMKCKRVLPVYGVSYQKQTGLLVISFNQTKVATLCKSCNTKLFWECMIHCLILGWWGIKSFFINVVSIVGNVNMYREVNSELKKRKNTT